jgi:hypothetical protein
MDSTSTLGRLSELRLQYENGQHQLELLDRKRHDLRDTLLRISGAIQVLEELLARNGNGSAAHEAVESVP